MPQKEHRAILQKGHNCWRQENARRVAIAVDAAAYFRAVREAILAARYSVFILGWDIHSKLKLVRDSEKDGFPDELGALLRAQDASARKRLLEGGPGRPGRAYRHIAAELRDPIPQQRALLSQVHEMLPACREKLRGAVSRRKAAEALRERLLREQAARQQRTEAAQVDDSHAVRALAARRAGG